MPPAVAKAAAAAEQKQDARSFDARIGMYTPGATPPSRTRLTPTVTRRGPSRPADLAHRPGADQFGPRGQRQP